MNVSIVMKLFDGVTAPIRRISSAIDAATKQIEGVKKRSDAAFKLSDSIRQSSEAMGRFGQHTRAVLTSISDSFTPFEHAMNRVRVRTNATQDEFAKLSDKARELGRNGAFGATAAAQAMEKMKIEGLSVTDILEQMNIVEASAIVNNAQLEDVIGSTAGMLDAFGKSASFMGRALNITQQVADSAGTSVDQVRDALSFAGAAAVESGVSFERLAVMTGLLATRNIEGGKAGATIEKMLKTLIDPTKEVSDGLKQIGVSTTEMKNGVKSLRDPLEIMMDLQARMTKEGTSAANQTKIMTMLFSKAAPDIQAMMRAAEGDGIDKMNTAIKETNGLLQKQAELVHNDSQGSIKELNGAFEDLKITIGEAVAPEINVLLKLLTNMVKGTREWVDEHPNLTKALLYTAGILGLVATALSGIMLVVSVLVGAKGLFLLATAMGIIGKVSIGALLPSLSTLLPVLYLVGTTLWGMIAPALALAAPFIGIGLVIGGVVFIMMQLIRLAREWESLDFGASWKGLKDAIGDGSVWKTMTLDGFTHPFRGMFQNGPDTLAPASSSSPGAGPLLPGEPMNGVLRIEFDDQGRPQVKDMQSQGFNMEAFTNAGRMLSQ